MCRKKGRGKTGQYPKILSFRDGKYRSSADLRCALADRGHDASSYVFTKRTEGFEFLGGAGMVTLQLVPVDTLCLLHPEKFEDISSCLSKFPHKVCEETDAFQAMGQNKPIRANVVFMTRSREGFFVQEYSSETGITRPHFVFSSHSLPSHYLVAVRSIDLKSKRK